MTLQNPTTMDFYERTGIMALGSRLRRLSETITQDSMHIYQLEKLNFEPKWFPVYYTLAHAGPLSVTEIAEQIGHTHPSVSQIAREMRKRGLLVTLKDKTDGRKSMLDLSEQGKTMRPTMDKLCKYVHEGVWELLQETEHNIWQAIDDLEKALVQKSLLERVADIRKTNEADQVQIVAYTPAYRNAFRDLNEAWIKQYFKMEEADHKALGDPDNYIIKPGGHIFMALYQEKPVGACALIKLDHSTYELAKMAVDPSVQGRGIGWLLAQAIINKAKNLGADRLFLESNTKLEPAINLYYKLGFKKIVGGSISPYERSNIKMELFL